MSDSMDDEVDRRITCYLCAVDDAPTFEQFTDFLLHLDEMHRPLKIYACHFCARAFSTKSNLLCHDCTPFQNFIDANGLGSCKNCNFAYKFRSLICDKCGLQMAINDVLDGVELIRFTAQFHKCLKIHDPKTFVHCIVCMLEVSMFESVALSFLTNDRSLRCGAEEAFLPTYLAAACQFRNPYAKRTNGERVGPSFHGEKSLPRVKKGFTHSTFFSRHQLENGAEEYECKMCKSRTVPDPTPCTLVQHIHDAHHPNRNVSLLTTEQATRNGAATNQQLRTFNAQMEFERIKLPDGNCQYQCRICGHLTKLNVKANCLSQHFNDRHPEMRLVASEAWVDHYLKRYGHLLSNTTAEADIVEEAEKNIVLVDRDAASINDFTRGFVECRTSIRVYFPPFQFFHFAVANRLQVLEFRVFACKQCHTICAGQRAATAHSREARHRLASEDSDSSVQDFISLSVSQAGRPAVRCPLCRFSVHCSIMALKLHLLREHDAPYVIRSKEEDEEFYIPEPSDMPPADELGNGALFAVSSVKQEIDSATIPADDVEVRSCSSDGSFNSQLQQILQNANHEINKKGSELGYLSKGSEYYEGSCISDFDDVRTKLENDGGDSKPLGLFPTDSGRQPSIGQPSENDLRVMIVEMNVQPTDGERREAAERAASAARAKLLKKNRFNAQKQFVMVESPEGPRYKCKVCDHVTKPGVSANTLSQHFSYRHPEMRARAAGESSYVRRKKLLRAEGTLVIPSATPGRKALAGALKRRGNNQFGYNGRTKLSKRNNVIVVSALNRTLSPQSEDDIVFGKFLQTIAMEEFERLERSQATVFPYFEIAMKANPRITYDLAGALSLLYWANVDANAERCPRITAFFGEFLRKCRSNNIAILCTIDGQLKSSEFSRSGLLRIADDLLRQNGF